MKWMTKKRGLLGRAAVIGAVCIALVAVFVGGAGARGRTVQTLGDEKFVANSLIQATLKFSPGQIRVGSGETVSWAHNDKTSAPHTVSIVDAADLPDSIEEVFECAVCEQIGEAHFGPDFGGPFTPVVDVGDAGFDQPGDSVFFQPGGGFEMTISAPAGTTLPYLCAIHPWMQGTITVV